MAKENEILKCNCEDDSNHISYEGKNGETVIECTECGRFLKFPKEDETEYQGSPKEVSAEELLEIRESKKKNDSKEKQTIGSNDVGRLEDVIGNPNK